jgi:hypothetical protein
MHIFYNKIQSKVLSSYTVISNADFYQSLFEVIFINNNKKKEN